MEENNEDELDRKETKRRCGILGVGRNGIAPTMKTKVNFGRPHMTDMLPTSRRGGPEHSTFQTLESILPSSDGLRFLSTHEEFEARRRYLAATIKASV